MAATRVITKGRMEDPRVQSEGDMSAAMVILQMYKCSGNIFDFFTKIMGKKKKIH